MHAHVALLLATLTTAFLAIPSHIHGSAPRHATAPPGVCAIRPQGENLIRNGAGSMNSELTNSILHALLKASDERKELALKVLHGEPIQPAGEPAIGPLLLGMGVAAELLGVSRPTLWRILRAGKIEKIELFPGFYRVRRTDIEALAAGKLGLTPYRSRRGRLRKDAAKGGAS